MMKIIKKIILSILVLMICVVIFICAYIKIRVDMDLRMYEKELEQSENIDMPINKPIFEEYIKDKYGVLNKSFNNIKYLGVHTGGRVRGTTGGHDWIRSYRITCDFLDNPFEVWIDNRTHEIFGDNFYDVLSTDSKFQHLYSDYIKEQIGLEDEDVEFEFGKNMDGARQLEDISIDFSNITSKDKYLEEIFNNISGYYLKKIYIKNTKFNDVNEYIDYAENIKNRYFDKLKTSTIEVSIYITNFDFKNDEEMYNKCGTKESFNNIIVTYDFKNKNKYYWYIYKKGANSGPTYSDKIYF